MFKRILTFVAAAAAAVTISSCQKDDKPTVEFEKSLYTAYAKRSVDVKRHPQRAGHRECQCHDQLLRSECGD